MEIHIYIYMSTAHTSKAFREKLLLLSMKIFKRKSISVSILRYIYIYIYIYIFIYIFLYICTLRHVWVKKRLVEDYTYVNVYL
jgi:hypothetical protein